ncbi:flagellar hook-basal body complex protein FliE [Candidatus Thorarchaeota archaeon]|nr:MAG: flagellar hook-basal body complex protein FliE [Candidatus Thorarchaeota archaeon]
MEVLLITGMPGAGKSEIANRFRAFGQPVVVMGDVVREVAKERGLEPNPKNTKNIMLELREKRGPGAIAKYCLENMGILDANLVVVEGCRSIAEMEVFRRRADRVTTVCIHASPATRFRRLQIRSRKDAPADWESFRERDMRELDVGLGGVIALSDIMLVNEGTKEELRREAEAVVKRFVDQ